MDYYIAYGEHAVTEDIFYSHTKAPSRCATIHNPKRYIGNYNLHKIRHRRQEDNPNPQGFLDNIGQDAQSQ